MTTSTSMSTEGRGFLPTTAEEVGRLGWDALDIIIVSGDTYIDSAYNGAAVIGRHLADNGFRVGIICQPDLSSAADIARLGKPRLFWSVTAGSVDSMVANYTPTRKFRKEDDFTPGGVNDRRPDRACIAYTNLIKKHCKGAPIVLGGIEASLRRIAHYDFWSDSVRRSILLDAKADIITYGMAELSNLELAQALRDGRDWKGIRGICYMSPTVPDGYAELPAYEAVSDGREKNPDFVRMTRMFMDNCDPVTAKGLVQAHAGRYLVQNPPQRYLTPEELDRVHSLGYMRAVHPYYAEQGEVRAMDTIGNSIVTHRGCYGDCSFCAIAVHQGRTVVSRTADSIVAEAERLAAAPGFDGVIRDVGGPTANMYGIECTRKQVMGACKDRHCLLPRPCDKLPLDHRPQIGLLKRIAAVPGVRKVFVASGVRHDMVVFDRAFGRDYLECLTDGHISGQLKIAPEHVSKRVLELMGKPDSNVLLDFKDMFDEANRKSGRDQYLTYYFMAAHPGCYENDMRELDAFIRDELRMQPEQIQVFTPTPSTRSTMMYHTRRNIEDTADIKAEHSVQMRQRQKGIVGPGDGKRAPKRRR